MTDDLEVFEWQVCFITPSRQNRSRSYVVTTWPSCFGSTNTSLRSLFCSDCKYYDQLIAFKLPVFCWFVKLWTLICNTIAFETRHTRCTMNLNPWCTLTYKFEPVDIVECEAVMSLKNSRSYSVSDWTVTVVTLVLRLRSGHRLRLEQWCLRSQLLMYNWPKYTEWSASSWSMVQSCFATHTIWPWPILTPGLS